MSVKTTRYKRLDSIEIKESLFKEFNLPDHFHDAYCFGFLQKGIKSSVVEGSSYLVHSNSVTIVNPYQVHADRNIDSDACHFKMIYVNREVVNYFAKKITGNTSNGILFTNDLITDPFVSSALLNFFTGMNNENLLNNKLMKLIEILIARYPVKNNIAVKAEDRTAIMDSIERARANFSGKIDIGKMANESKLSKYQFIRYFRKMTGLTPAAYIIVNRINFAKTLLVKGTPVGQVALEAGFYDHPQFCRFFKYYTNLSPTDYKRSCNMIQA